MKNNDTIKLIPILCLLVVGGIQPVLAQEDAGRIEKRFEQLPEPKSTLQPLFIPLQEQLPPAQAAQIHFTLKELRLTGNTAFSTTELQSLYADQLGKEISLLDLYRIRDAITAKYGNAGYGLSRAVIPEQRIQADGIVRIEIIEGFIDKVIIEGADNEQRAFLDYASEKIRAERPLNVKTLERYLLLANDRFTIKVTATMKRSDKTPGASSLILKVEPAPQFEGGASLDNRGTDSVGPWQIRGNVSVNGLFGRAAKTSLAYITTSQTDELRYVALSHTDVVTDEGATLTFAYSHISSDAGDPVLKLLEQHSKGETWSIRLSHPFIRTRQENLTGHIEYENNDNTNESLGAVVSKDRIRSVRTGLSYDRADVYDGTNQALLELSVGLDGLGATDSNSPLKSRADGKVDYRKLTLNLSRDQQLGYFDASLTRFSAYAGLMAQYADSGLLSAEECGLGGQQFGRAYDSSEILGDRCLAGSLELRYLANVADTPFKYAQFYGFYDIGKTQNEHPLSPTDSKNKSLASAGLGIRFGIQKHVTGAIEAAKPLTRVVANEGNKDPRIFASLVVRF